MMSRQRPVPESGTPEPALPRRPLRPRALGLRKAYKVVRRIAYGGAGLGMIMAFAGQLLPKKNQALVVPVGFSLILLGFMLLVVGYGLFIAIKLKETP